ncbi:ribonuclease P [Candidatus Woesearchaeota archaeon]|nr:ribonuclease P [Candidatus Woesearchaeota archaeon]MBW3021281.1 ribonuclease P [Candidatus Woesearchaeota archaeon]
MAKKRDKIDEKRIAKERINILFEQADKRFNTDKALSNRYVTLARNISMKYKVRIPRELKRKFCKHCYKFLKPGVNLRIRTRKDKVVYYCMECKKFMRFVKSKKKF